MVGIRIAAGLGSAAHTTLERVGDLGSAGAGNEAGYTRFACLAAPQQFASEHQRITSPLPYVGSLRWWLRPKKVARNVKTGETSTLLRQRRVVRLDENLDGLFAGVDKVSGWNSGCRLSLQRARGCTRVVTDVFLRLGDLTVAACTRLHSRCDLRG
jgi:hypothetical protein